jgi:hypothetical protein
VSVIAQNKMSEHCDQAGKIDQDSRERNEVQKIKEGQGGLYTTSPSEMKSYGQFKGFPYEKDP